MAIFHVATNTPPKSEIIAAWLHKQPWGPGDDSPVELTGSFHLDDPDGEVGIQVFVVDAGGALFQVPLTYRATALPGADHALMGIMEHSVLGTRYVYDGLGDDRFLVVIAGVAACGYGQALGFAEHDGSWHAVPDELLLRGTGTIGGRVAVDGLVIESTDSDRVVLSNGDLELVLYRRLSDRPAPPVGLTATWAGQPTPITIAQVRQR